VISTSPLFFFSFVIMNLGLDGPLICEITFFMLPLVYAIMGGRSEPLQPSLRCLVGWHRVSCEPARSRTYIEPCAWAST
jgi:hypothetical protein